MFRECLQKFCLTFKFVVADCISCTSESTRALDLGIPDPGSDLELYPELELDLEFDCPVT